MDLFGWLLLLFPVLVLWGLHLIHKELVAIREATETMVNISLKEYRPPLE